MPDTDHREHAGASRTAPDVSAVLAAAPLPLVLTTTDARIVFANRAMQRLLGVAATDLNGRFLAEFAGPPHGRLRRLAAVATAAAHPVTTEVSFSLGRRRSIAVRVVVARGAAADGDPFLVWQVTASPTAHALAEPSAGDAPPTAPTAPTGAGPGHATGDEGRPATAADSRAVTLEMFGTAADEPVHDVAGRLAALAATAFGALPVRISLDGPRHPPVEAASDPVATLAVQVEAELGGPGPVGAAAAGTTVVVDDLAADDRFAPAGPELARRLGLSSVLAAPLRRGHAVLGTLAVFDDVPAAFGDDQVRLAEWVAAAAGAVLDAAVRYRSAVTETEQIRTAMTSRAVIEQAKGILMALHRVDEEAAFAMLRVESQTRNRRLRDVALGVVEDVVAGRVPVAFPRPTGDRPVRRPGP